VNSTPCLSRYSICSTGWLIAGLVVGTLSSDLLAERYRWIAGGQVGQWDDAANWSLEDGFPGALDEASLVGGHAIVNQAKAKTLILDGQLASGQLEVLEFAFISNSQFSLGHELTLGASTPTSYTGLNPTSLRGGSKIINHGIFDVFAEGVIQFEDASMFLNQSSTAPGAAKARFIINLDPEFDVNFRMVETQGKGSVFVNDGGEFVNRSPGGITSMDVRFDNQGLVSAEEGTIKLNLGGTHGLAQFLTTGTNQVIFNGGTNRFQLSKGDIEFGPQVVWEKGGFLLESGAGKLKTQAFNVRGAMADIKGFGNIEASSFEYRPPSGAAQLRIGGGVRIQLTNQFVADGPATQVLLEGDLNTKGQITLNNGAKLRVGSQAVLRFQNDASQSVRNLGGEGLIENEGRMEFHAKSTTFRAPFESVNGALSIISKPATGERVLKLTESVRIENGASLGEKGRIQIDSSSGASTQLGGEFAGKGTIEVKNTALEISKNLQIRGPHLSFDQVGDMVFQGGALRTFEISSLDRTVWQFHDRDLRITGPGQLINSSGGIDVTGDSVFGFNFRLKNMEFINDGEFVLGSSRGTASLDFEKTSIVNSDHLVLGEGVGFFTLSMSDDSSIKTTGAGEIRLRARDVNRLFGPALRLGKKMLLDGKLSVEIPGAKLLVEGSWRLEGETHLNGGGLVIGQEVLGSRLEFGPKAVVQSLGGEPIQIDVRAGTLAASDRLAIKGNVDLHNAGGLFGGRLELPITGGLSASSLKVNSSFGSNSKSVIITAPNSFVPGRNLGLTFVVIKTDGLSGLQPNQVRLDGLPGGASHYRAEVISNELRITVISAPPETGIELGDGFDGFIDGFFDDESSEEAKSAGADPDRDGKSNGFEFATGSDPTVPDPSGIKVEVVEENGQKKLRLAYPKSQSAGGVKIEVQSSLSLQGEFLPIDPEELLGERRQPDPAKPGVDRIELDLPLLPGTPSRFFRFDVQGEDILPE
jgi:hypothetical protein